MSLSIIATEIGAVIGIAASVAVIITTGIAIWQLIEVRNSRLDQIRPFVTVSFSPTSMIKLEVANIGPVPAKNVFVSTIPELDGNTDYFKVKHLSIFNDGLPILMPGQILKFNFDFSSDRLNPDHRRLNRYEVKVKYFDNNMKRQFEDNYILDISSLIGVSLVPEDWDAVVYSLNKIQLALWELAKKIV